jgi:hypothetical protein
VSTPLAFGWDFGLKMFALIVVAAPTLTPISAALPVVSTETAAIAKVKLGTYTTPIVMMTIHIASSESYPDANPPDQRPRKDKGCL